jgi:hypothetical protein
MRTGRWHNGGVTDNAVDRDVTAKKADTSDSEDALIARIAADRRAGKDTTRDVEALLRITSDTNQAALDRLGK